MKDFKVVAVSENTNSFGLRQMIAVARDGEVYKTCANSLNVKPVGAIITMNNGMFRGCELTEEAGLAPESITKKVWEA